MNNLLRKNQGWEFAHRFSELVALFFAKNERMSYSLKKTSNLLTSLIFGEGPERFAHGHPFLVSDLSDSLTSLIFGEQPEQFAHIAHFW